MAIIGTLLKKGIKLRESLEQEYSSPFDLQKSELRKLIIAARESDFGRHYKFKEILQYFKKPEIHGFYKRFISQVPIHSYNDMYNNWWQKAHKGGKNISWPGKVRHFALSSGTSESASKYIPVTKEMIKAIQKTSIRQILTLSRYELPDNLFTTGILMLGGSTHLNHRGTYFEGDLSGITASQIPFWFQHFYKPGTKIAKITDWNSKLDEIAEKAGKWNIGVIVGVPAWIQILIEKIVAHYQVETIHDVWPNLSIYVHGGVSFDPYRKGFEKLLGKPLNYIETYLASEGFIAFQTTPNRSSMRLVMNNGLFYEFVPFNEENFNEEGDIKSDANTLMIDEIEEGKEYALLLSSCSGAWRYMIGDVVKMVSKEESEIIITGRTKHFLSLCGEHLSVDNMNKAVQLVSNDLNIDIKEFTVAGIPYQGLFAHQWYVGTDNPVDTDTLTKLLDNKLMELNDDYKVERSAALKKIMVDVLPANHFYEYLKLHGKEGGQNKFPRVMKKSKFADWKSFVESKKT